MEINEFKFTGKEEILKDGTIVKEICATVDIPEWEVKAGDIGGYVEDAMNLIESVEWIPEGDILTRA